MPLCCLLEVLDGAALMMTEIESLEPFKFDNLPNQCSFRVTELLPGCDEEPISCLIHTVDLRDPPNYGAISYVWGDTRVKAPVNCNCGRLDITLSLHRALLHLRLRSKSRFLWADALWYVMAINLAHPKLSILKPAISPDIVEVRVLGSAV